MENRIKKTLESAALLGLAFGLQHCIRPEISGQSDKPELAYGALSWGVSLNWTAIYTAAGTDTILDLAMGADGSVFTLKKAKSASGKLGTVYQYVPNLNSLSWVNYGDTAASALGIDTSGRPWGAKRNTVMKWTGSGGPKVWSATATNPPDTVRDIAITESGTLYALVRGGSQSEGKIYKWSGDIASASTSGSWDSVGARAVAFAAGQGGRLLKADSTGRIDSLSGTSTWNYVDSIPTREIASGIYGRIWITLKNSPAGGDTIAYKQGTNNFLKMATGSHIACHGMTLWGVSSANVIFRGSANRSFETSFEDFNDVGTWNFSHEPTGTVSQDTSTTVFKHGRKSHWGQVDSASGPTNDDTSYHAHRAYPYIRIYQLPGGALGRRTLTSMWVRIENLNLQDRAGTDDWFSFATLSSDTAWNPLVGVNLNTTSKVLLYHVPVHGQGPGTCPGGNCSVTFSQNQWVRLDMYMDTDPTVGKAKVWQNGTLVQYADITGHKSKMAFAHFGMYASPMVAAGRVYNDKLRIQEVGDSTEAQLLVNAPF